MTAGNDEELKASLKQRLDAATATETTILIQELDFTVTTGVALERQIDIRHSPLSFETEGGRSFKLGKITTFEVLLLSSDGRNFNQSVDFNNWFLGPYSFLRWPRSRAQSFSGFLTAVGLQARLWGNGIFFQIF